MANEITLKTRLLNKYDQTIAPTEILGAGEINFVEVKVPLQDGDKATIDAVLMKVGDGHTEYQNLDYVVAPAADVYAWAKKARGEANDIYYNKTTKQQGENGEILEVTKAITTQDAIDALYEAIATLSGDSGASIADLISRIGTIEADYLKAAALTPYATTEALNGKIAEVNSNLNKKVDQVAGKSLVSDTEIARLADVDNYDDTQVKADIAKNTTAASNAQAAAEAAQSDVNAIKADYLKTADKTELSNAITTEANRAKAAEKVNADAIAAIEADYLTSEDKTELTGAIGTVEKTAEAAKTAIEAFLKDADATANAVDTLKEIQAELDAGEASAASMLAKITALEEVDNATQAELDAAVSNLNTAIDKKADSTTVNGIAGRVETLETAGYATTTQVATAKSEAISAAATDAASKADAALASAKTYADQAEADAVATAAADAKTKADKAESNANTHATNLNTAMDTRVKALEDIDHNAYKAADTALHTAISAEIDADVEALANGAVKTNTNAIATLNGKVDVTKVSTAIANAKTEAINAAATDATTKANTAKSEAISVASADATSKANAAKSGAISEIKNFYKEGDGITLSDSGVIGIADSSTGFTFILDANA